MSKIISACESLEFEAELSAMKEREYAGHPPRTRELWTGGIMRDDIPSKEYVTWLEIRRDHWITEATEMRIKNKRILKEIGQIISNKSGEQALDEIRALVEKWG